MERQERNLIIFGQTPVEKCVLANVLASTKHEKCRIFQAKNPNNRHITVRSFRSTYIQNTRLMLFVVPKKDCRQYIEFLEKMKSYRNRFIFYVLNSTNIHDYDPVQEVRTLMSNIGTHRTRYIPVVYRDTEHLRAPINKQEQSFLNEFPGTHFHAPLIHGNSYGSTKQQMLFEYLQYAYENKGPDCYGKYPTEEYLCLESQKNTNPSLPKSEIGRQATALSEISLVYSGDHGFSTATDVGIPKTASYETENAEGEDMQTESRTAYNNSYRELHDEDHALFDDAKSHHVRIMVVGPNGAGKTTLIKRLKMESNCCSTLRPPTEGIDIENTVIRCRLVNDKLEWEVESAENDFKRALDAQKIAAEMQNIEKGRNRDNISRPIMVDSSATGTVGAAFDGSVSGRRLGLETAEQSGDNEITDTVLSQNINEAVDDDSFYTDNTQNSETLHAFDTDMKGNTGNDNPEVNEAVNDNSARTDLPQNSDTDKVNNDMTGNTGDNNCKKGSLIKEALRHKENTIVPWTYCSIWDFAGYAAYYSTHQMFLSSSVIYLLVVDLSKDLDVPIEHLPDTADLGMFKMTEAESLKFWLGSIQQHTSYFSDISICLVATHKDRIADSNMADERLTKLFDELQVCLECFILDNTITEGEQDDLNQLKEFIEYSAHTLVCEHIPANWTQIEDTINHAIQNDVFVMDLTNMVEALSDLSFDEDTILSFLHYQHSRGDLQFHLKESACLSEECTENGDDSESDIDELKRQKLIFLDPTILIQFVNLILRRRPKENYRMSFRIYRHNVNYFPEGVLDDEYVSHMLRTSGNKILLKYKEEIITQLLQLHILFTFRVQNKEFMFMPCLLRYQPSEDIVNQFERVTEQSTILVIRFTTSYVSQVVFHQLIAALHDYYMPLIKKEKNVDKCQVYCDYVSFNLSFTRLQQLQLYWRPNGIHLRISNMSRKKLLRAIVIKDVTLGQATLDMTLDCLNEVLTTYRNLPDYKLMVICPEHVIPPTMVPFDILLEKGACLCTGGKGHKLTKEQALKFWISPGSIAQVPVKHSIQKQNVQQRNKLPD